MITNIGSLFGRSTDNVDVEFAIDAGQAAEIKGATDVGIFAVIPTNIFASLSSNDSVRVLVFAVLFGIAMVLTERESGHSIFEALRHIQAVCVLIFDWFSLLVPIGIVALVAPQVARLGPDAFTALTLFAYPLLATSALLLLAAPMLCAFALPRVPRQRIWRLAEARDARASTRNSLICVPLALETLKNDLKVKKSPATSTSHRHRDDPVRNYTVFRYRNAFYRYFDGAPVYLDRSGLVGYSRGRVVRNVGSAALRRWRRWRLCCGLSGFPMKLQSR